jgi:hypothetical protein
LGHSQKLKFWESLISQFGFGGQHERKTLPCGRENLPEETKTELKNDTIIEEDTVEDEETPSEAKSITITNFDAAFNAKWLVLYLETGGSLTAGGIAWISDGSATVPLKLLSGISVTQTDWTGSGSFTGYCMIFETENDTTDINKRIFTGDISAFTVSEAVTTVDAAEKLIFEYPFDDAGGIYNQLYLKIGITVNSGNIPAGYRVRVSVFLDEACQNHKGGNSGPMGGDYGATPVVVDYKTAAYTKARRIYFGVQLAEIDTANPQKDKVVKTTPIPGKYLDLNPGSGTYGSSSGPFDLGTVDVTYSIVPAGSRSITIGSAPDCVIKVTDTESNIDYNNYNSVNTLSSITSAPQGSTVYVAILPQNPATRLIRLNPLTVTGVPSGSIAYCNRFTNTYGPIFGAVYRFTVPAQDITISAPGAAVSPVTVTGTVSLTLNGGLTLASTENGGLSIDFSTAGFESTSLAGTHVNNVLG